MHNIPIVIVVISLIGFLHYNAAHRRAKKQEQEKFITLNEVNVHLHTTIGDLGSAVSERYDPYSFTIQLKDRMSSLKVNLLSVYEPSGYLLKITMSSCFEDVCCDYEIERSGHPSIYGSRSVQNVATATSVINEILLKLAEYHVRIQQTPQVLN